MAVVFKAISEKSVPLKFVGNVSLMVFLGVFVVGFPTYVRNTAEKGIRFSR